MRKFQIFQDALPLGASLADAITQITDAMNAWLVFAEDNGNEIAPPTPQSQLMIESGSAISLIVADTIEYRSRVSDNHAVRKNVSLPHWMASLADKQGINCSQVLQTALYGIFNNTSSDRQ